MRIGYGTDKIAGKLAIDLCRHAYDVGYRIFDTALAYGNLVSIGQAFHNYTDRSKIKIISKIARPDIEEFSVKTCVEKILYQLQIDYIDVLLIHSPKDINHEQVMSEMLLLQQEDKILKVGVSNYTIRHLEILKAIGLIPEVSQMEIHPYLIENDYESYCRKYGIEIFSHTSLTNGKVIQDKLLKDLATQHSCSVAQLVLLWLIARGITPIMGSKNLTNISANVVHELKGLNENQCAQINSLNLNLRMCKNPFWSDFD